MRITADEYRKTMGKYLGGRYTTSEHDLQKACVQWFRLKYPRYAKLLMAIPNGARRTKFERVQVIEEGLVSGVPDLFLAIPNGKAHGLWIEMKNGKAGRVSDNQTEMMKLLWDQNYECRIARSFGDFEQIITEYLSW